MNIEKRINGRVWLRVRCEEQKDAPAEILLIGPIGCSWDESGGNYEREFREALDIIPQNREILLRINSEGGSVQDGLGIYNAILARRAHVTARIDGYAASIASVIPLAAGRVISPRASIWMIHEPWTSATGDAEEMERTANMLHAHARTLVSIYAERTGKDPDEIREAMKAETWMSGDEALAFGLADEVSEDNDEIVEQHLRAAALDPAKFRNPPPRVVAIYNSARGGAPIDRKEAMNEAQNQALTDDVSVLRNQIEALERANREREEALARERRARHESIIDRAIQEYRVDASERDDWLALFAEHEERARRMLDARQARPPGVAPVVEVSGPSGTEIVRAIVQASAPIEAWRRGNAVSGREISLAAQGRERLIRSHREQLHVLAASTNTISSDLKRQVILSDMLRAFKRKIIRLSVFSTVYENVPLRTEGGTDEVAVPYFPLATTPSDNFDVSTGYDVEVNTNHGAKKVTVDKRKYQQFSLASVELARQPYFNVPMQLTLLAEQLALDVWTDVLSVVTASTYGAPAKTTPAAGFDLEDVVDLRTVAEQADWPESGRTLIVDSAYEGNLLKNPHLLSASDTGTTESLRNGVVRRLLGFDMVASPRVPDNSENLVGFICLPSAILVATAPVEPAPGVRNLLMSYDLVIDPDTGIGFSYRHGGNDILDRDYHVIECAYGYAAGEAAALKRITSAP